MPFHEQEDLIRDLVLNDHTALEDTPLSLAIYFQSRRFPQEECVFEVLHRFGMDEVSEERMIFQVQFGRTSNFPLPEGDRLHLFLTNPNETLYAIKNGWPEIVDICDAIRSDQYKVVYHRDDDPDADDILSALKRVASMPPLAAVAA